MVASGPGGPGEVRVLGSATGSLLLALAPFGADFRGALAVATCELTGDGIPDLIVGGAGPAGPELRGIDGATGAPLPAPLAVLAPFAAPALGSARADPLGAPAVACADVDGDGIPDIIAGAPGGAPEAVIRVLSGADGALIREVPAFAPSSRGGLAVGP